MLRGVSDPTGETVRVDFPTPVAISWVSVLPRADGSARLKAIDVITRARGRCADAEATAFRGRAHKSALARGSTPPTCVHSTSASAGW